MHASRIGQPRADAARAAAHALGNYPTPVRRLAALETRAVELWLKDDGAVHPLYGGNKVRKLELLLQQARACGARRILTAGTAGSHHALATALFGGAYGFETAAALCPQVWTPHAESTLRASLAAGLDVLSARSMAEVPLVMARARRPGDFVVPPGGASITGTLGYVRAVRELVQQVDAGALPEPDVIVAAVGSGSTVAGLSAGIVREGLKSRVMGITVSGAGRRILPWVLFLAQRALRRDGGARGLGRLRQVLQLDDRFGAAGYGVPSAAGARAAAAAREMGLSLDPTYTEKSFAAALGLVGFGPFQAPPAESAMVTSGRPFRVLYWHTLSTAPLGGLVERSVPHFGRYENLFFRL
jgi:D-cysteine desulfhydrase